MIKALIPAVSEKTKRKTDPVRKTFSLCGKELYLSSLLIIDPLERD